MPICLLPRKHLNSPPSELRQSMAFISALHSLCSLLAVGHMKAIILTSTQRLSRKHLDQVWEGSHSSVLIAMTMTDLHLVLHLRPRDLSSSICTLTVMERQVQTGQLNESCTYLLNLLSSVSFGSKLEHS